MSTILFELGSEELPPKSLKPLRDSLKASVETQLQDANISYDRLKVMAVLFYKFVNLGFIYTPMNLTYIIIALINNIAVYTLHCLCNFILKMPYRKLRTFVQCEYV